MPIAAWGHIWEQEEAFLDLVPRNVPRIVPVERLLYRYNSTNVKPAQIVDMILEVVFPDAKHAVDLTPGKGNFWTQVPRVNVELSKHDFRNLPYADCMFDVSFFDPPHNADMGQDSVMKHFGTYKHVDLKNVIQKGCLEASRVSRLGCVVKVADQTHAQRFQHESAWVVEALGEPYEITHGTHHKVRDPKWKLPQCSVYNNGSVYLIYRHGDQKHIRRSSG